MTVKQYDVLLESIVNLSKTITSLSTKIDDLKIANDEISQRLDTKLDVEGKLQALAIEISNLKDEKEI